MVDYGRLSLEWARARVAHVCVGMAAYGQSTSKIGWLMSSSVEPVNPRGPVFVSYRQSDGTKRATRLAWVLRAAGVPVWHDASDLPPGDTRQRLAEALRQGLSGGVLLITPEITLSDIVRNTELPRLLDLEKNSDFVLAVGNTICRPDGRLDHDAPDRLLGQPKGTIRRLNQHGAGSRGDLVKIAREILVYRTARLAAARTTSRPHTLHVSLQTRSVPHANDQDAADLSIRLRPSTEGRLPSPKGLKDLHRTLPLLPETIPLFGADAVRISGGAHLSVAFALGCALPTTLIGDVSVEGTDRSIWRSSTVSTPPGSEPLTLIAGDGARARSETGTARAVLAYVDLLPDLSNAAYTRLLDERDFDAWQHIRPVTEGPLDPVNADRLITEVAGRLRKLAQDHDNADLHITLRVPFPIAVLLGRLLNTQQITVYEWDPTAPPGDADNRPRFVPVLLLNPTSADGPIKAVLLEKP
jgi:hypothetical protein